MMIYNITLVSQVSLYSLNVSDKLLKGI
jgi:hypothetical protein